MNRRSHHQQKVTYLITAALLIGATGCKQTQQKPVKSQPADTPAFTPSAVTIPPATQPTVIKPPATRPAATQPTATKPAATLPASTYDSKPPYPVKLYVRKAEDKQPGWLKIVELANPDIPAKAVGTFPKQNRFYVETNNVRQISLHVSHLPLSPRGRIILQIDNQGIEISRKKGRKYVTLERRPTGQWVGVKKSK
ncbi:MAG: hypothetical protein ACYTF1_01165 [Planctomycetota bacterium]|jgi:hypothetical protein